MALAIILIILFVLCVILLIPVRVKGFYGRPEGPKWGFSVRYAWLKLYSMEETPKPPPDLPPKPEDDGEPYYGKPGSEPEPEPEPKPQKKKKKKPKPEPKPETAEIAEINEMLEEAPAEPALTEETVAETGVADGTDVAEEPEKPKKKRGIRGFIERLKPHSLSDVLGLVQDGCAALSPALRFLTRHLHFRHVKLYAAVASDDPAKTAQTYGKYCAAVYNLLGQLQCWVDIQAEEIRILADFFGTKTDLRAELELRVSPAAAIVLALTLGIRFLWRTLRRFRREDREAKRYEQETAPLNA